MQLPPIDLLTLHTQLQQLRDKQTEREAWLLELLQLLLGLTNAAGAAYALPDKTTGKLALAPRILSRQALDWRSDLENLLLQEMQLACEQNRVRLTQLDQHRQIWLIAAPVPQTQHPEAITLVLLLGGYQTLETFVTILQLVASYAGIDHTQNRTQQQVLHLLLELLHLGDMQQAERHLLNRLQTACGCQRVILGYRQGHHCRIQAMSELPDAPRHVDLSHAIESLMDDTLQTKQAFIGTTNDAHRVSPHLQKILGLTATQQIWSLPLPHHQQLPAHYALVLLWTTPPAHHVPPLLTQLSNVLGIALTTLRRTKQGRWQQILNTLKRRLIWGSLLVSILLIPLFIPVTHTIAGKVTIQPDTRRFITAPFAGILKTTQREAGDVVKTGDILAQLDEREIQLELTGLTAERNRLAKQKDASAAAKDTVATQLAQLEKERAESQIALLEYRIANLEIKTPIDGLVISGDLQRVQGSPVEKGQSLFEVAPLATMRVELAIPADDIAYVRVDMPLEMELDAYPQQRWQLTASRIQPRATVRDSEAVFIIESILNNTDNKLRPGMKGEGKIAADQQLLGWVLFHKVWETILRWLY
ncbi:efflux RND transporter periplasmic adaptor subunit [Beggiatoa leptomitoformis]|uniref:HlyD family efflux transporter periplasmic adaptor subunit n=1 Tax=Beggiatoa leptomitoformis TaxID=288004 RepID=A0A650GDT5_9GAMM|nr:efflux RND transporter periplasmic adaptor subunit [Beggiatoa leptomitoformis]QGX03510.1 HlyD family efflux transporter periplasmic adaptor subunit [Beggiatoa leptomitoformis]QGX04038.1 HlyD family efflux transporter periplasmic adaptor subunit [Beggiatoa leptomitoformis]